LVGKAKFNVVEDDTQKIVDKKQPEIKKEAK